MVGAGHPAGFEAGYGPSSSSRVGPAASSAQPGSSPTGGHRRGRAVTEAHIATTRRVARPLSLGGLFGLFLVLVIGLSPAVAATGSARNRTHRDGAAGRRTPARQAAPSKAASADVVTSALPVEGPRQVTLGLSRLFTTQFDGSPYANGNCNMAAGAMLFEVQTGRLVTGAQMRRWSRARTARHHAHGSATRLPGARASGSRSPRTCAGMLQRRGPLRPLGGGPGLVRQPPGQRPPGRLHDRPLGVRARLLAPRQGWPRRVLRDGPAWLGRLRRRLVDQAGAASLRLERTAQHGRHRPHRLLRQRRAPVAAPATSACRARPTGPQFQSYWDTGKALMRRAKQVNLVERRPGQSPVPAQGHGPAPEADPVAGAQEQPGQARQGSGGPRSPGSASTTSGSSCAPSR